MNREYYMKAALDEAVKGMGHTAPNPMVGAVIVKDGRIISRGFHQKFGGPHAERNAINSCSGDMNGAELYVTLEPCCHHGKTPPCTEAVIQSGIKKVYIGSDDPNPLVAGKGADTLRQHGIEVERGVLKEDCDRLNEVFFHYITKRTPFTVLKYAMTADGKTACYTGESRWISGGLSRENVHLSRLRYSAVMVGVETVLADDPLLTCRIENGRNPLRIICDSRLRTPSGSRIAQTAHEVPTIIACLDGFEGGHLEEKGVKLLRIPEKGGHIDLNMLAEKLGELEVDSVLLEGGSQLAYSALEAGIVNRVQAYISPKIFGGENAPTPVGGQGAAKPSEGFGLKNPRLSRFGDDFLIDWEVCLCSRE